MKILSITAGAGAMYCGSCLRDNALATELMRRGHDVMLLPLYTPTKTDEANVSESRVFFGGISVYLEQKFPVFRNSPRVLDKLWDSVAALRLATGRSISVNPASLGPLTVSMLRGEGGNQHKEVEKLVEWLKHEPPPDLTVLPTSLLISLARPIREATGRPVVVTFSGEDLFLDGLEGRHRSESVELMRAHVPHVDAFVATGDYYADFMGRLLSVPGEKIRAVPLGINLEGFAPRPQRAAGAPYTVGFFGRVAPEKGLRTLAEAYCNLRGRGELEGARLEVAGYLAPEHAGYLRGVERLMRDCGLASEFNYRGSPDREGKIEFLRSLDLFSLPATYDEPKGLSLIEALACGVPAVVPRRGALTEIVGRTGGGVLVEPDSPEALAEGILSLAKDPARAEELGRAGAAGVREQHSVGRMADRALEVYEEITRGPLGRASAEGAKAAQVVA